MCGSGAPPNVEAPRSGRHASGQLGRDRFGSGHLVAHAHAWMTADRKVQIHARAEADESVSLPALQSLAGIYIAQDSARDEPGDLHAGDVMTVVGANPQRHAFIFFR